MIARNTGFHSKDGWYWERTPEDGVLIQLETPQGNIIAEHRLTAEAWASIVASVSRRGEESGRFYEALEFHRGAPHSEPCLPCDAAKLENEDLAKNTPSNFSELTDSDRLPLT